MSVARVLRFRVLLTGLSASIAMAGVAAVGTGTAQAAGTWWHLSSVAAPTTLPSGGEAQIVATASNLGYEDATGTLTISDRLPAGVELVPGSVRGVQPGIEAVLTRAGKASKLTCTEAAPLVSCTTTNKVSPYGAIELLATVKVTAAAGASLSNEVKLEGGTPTAPLVRSLSVGSSPGNSGTSFGVQNYELEPENETGNLETQAGKHPFQLDDHARDEPDPQARPGRDRNRHWISRPGS